MGRKVMSLIGRISGKLNRWEEAKYKNHVAVYDRQLRELEKVLSNNSASLALAETVRRAWSVGSMLDLSGLEYGPPHSKHIEKADRTIPSYYAFLAGLVRAESCQRILEVGTYFGGSITAMDRGLVDPSSAKIATVDIADVNPKLSERVSVKRFIGDANSEHVLKDVIAFFSAEPIDLLYLDGDHNFLPTIVNVGLYTALLKPRYLVLDDIVFNESMRSAWTMLKCCFGNQAINCIDIEPRIRTSTCGFGLLRLR
jgi:predicted O-methyltransferase YrrM